MNKDIIIKLLKSGNEEDVFIALNLIKDWTIGDILSNLPMTETNTPTMPARINLEDSTHIRQAVKLNDYLYMIPGGHWSIFFAECLPESWTDYINL